MKNKLFMITTLVLGLLIGNTNPVLAANSVATGDNTDMVPYILLFVLAALAIIVLFIFKRRKNKDDDNNIDE